VNGQGPSVTIPASACSTDERADPEDHNPIPFSDSNADRAGTPKSSTAVTPEVAPFCRTGLAIRLAFHWSAGEAPHLLVAEGKG
jgi:hypothetical protein